MNKSQLFEKYIYDICGKTRTKTPKIIKNSLCDYAAWCNGYNRISYNPVIIIQCRNKELMSIASHEVGHLRSNAITRDEREYKAELFSLKAVYKHYPKLFTLYYAKVVGKENKKIYEKPFKKAIRDFKKWRTKQNDN